MRGGCVERLKDQIGWDIKFPTYNGIDIGGMSSGRNKPMPWVAGWQLIELNYELLNWCSS